METESGIGEETAVTAGRMGHGAGGRAWFGSLVIVSSLIIGHSSLGQSRKGVSVGEPPADHSPAAELASFTVLEGFQVNLFADETDGIPNPIAIRWDERGRLWVLQTSVYPQPKPSQTPDDKIIILEDTDRDGRADKRTVFAGGLCQPMGMELAPYESGNQKAESGKAHSVYVGEGEKLWLFHDDDGDDRVDRREVVLSGFGTGDTHQNINSFVWSPDGALVMHQGLHCYSKVVTPHGTRTLYGAGFWHYRPRSGKLDAYPTGMPLNPWGTAFTNEGQPIMVAGAAGMYWARPMEISTADTDVRGSSESKSIPHFLLERFQLPYGGQCIKTEGLTKFCGVDIAGNVHWPESMQGELVTGGFFENKVFRYQLRDDAEFPSGIEAVEQPALITSSNVAFRPIDIRFGPDGACYIADWYDPIIGHYQASFRHPNRDQQHGRIWRVMAKGRETSKWEVVSAQLAELREGNVSATSERWLSYQLQRLVSGEAAAKRLIRSTIGDSDWLGMFREAPPEHRKDVERAMADEERRHAAIYTEALKGFEQNEELPDSDMLRHTIRLILSRGEPAARAQAARFFGTFAEQLPDALKLIEARTADDSPHVRLEAVVAAAKVAKPEAIKVALKVLDKPMDSYLERALWLAVQATRRHWFPSPQPSPMASLAGNAAVDGRGGQSASSVVSDQGNPPLPSTTSSGSRQPLGEGRGEGNVSGATHVPTEAFRLFLSDMPPAHIAFLIQREGSAALRDIATNLLKQPDLMANVREGLTLALAKPETGDGLTREEATRLKQGSGSAEKLQALVSSTTATPRLRNAALARLAKAFPASAGSLVAQRANDTKDLAAMKALLAPVLPMEAATKAMIEALKTKPCSADAAKLMLRVLTSTGRSEPELSAVLSGILGTSNAVPAYDPAWVSVLVTEVKAVGNAAKGQQVFKSTLTNCTACHSIGKQGGTIGPELDAVGRGVPVELIIEALVWPNRQIKEGYIASSIVTHDGRRLQGYKVSEANSELQLRDFLGGGVTKLAASDIASRQDSGSLMPEGLVALMTREELRDVIAYLLTLGK